MMLPAPLPSHGRLKPPLPYDGVFGRLKPPLSPLGRGGFSLPSHQFLLPQLYFHHAWCMLKKLNVNVEKCLCLTLYREGLHEG